MFKFIQCENFENANLYSQFELTSINFYIASFLYVVPNFWTKFDKKIIIFDLYASHKVLAKN